MKINLKRISKSTLSIILAIMTMISTMLIGTFTTNAASNNTSFADGETIYLNINKIGWSSNAKIAAIFYYKDNTSWAYQSNGTGNGNYDTLSNNKSIESGFYTLATQVDGDIYKVTVPTGTTGIGSLSFIRLNNNENEIYNYSARMTNDSKSSNNCVKLNGWDNNSDWTTYDTGSGSSTKYYLVGDDAYSRFAGATSNWGSSTGDATEMTLVSDGVYEKSLTNNTSSKITCKFKVVDSNGNWSSTGDTTETVPVGSTLTVTYTASTNTFEANVTAATPTTYTVTAGTNITGGTVTVSSDGTNYGTTATVAENGTVYLKATPADGYSFTSWDTAGGLTYADSSSATTTATVTKAATVSATFTKTYTVTAGTQEGGTVKVGLSASDCTHDSVTVAAGSTVYLKATANDDYTFTSWNQPTGLSISETGSAVTQATVTGDAEVTANFSKTPSGDIEWYVGGHFGSTSGWTQHPDTHQMTLVSGTLYKIETGKTLSNWKGSYFLIYSKQGSTYTDYGYSTQNQAIDSYSSSSNTLSLSVITQTGERQLYFNNTIGNNEVTLYFDSSTKAFYYTTSTPAPAWYLSGWIGKSGDTHTNVAVGTADFKFTQSAEDPNIYTLSYIASGKEQYPNVNDGTNVYHPTSDKAASGSAASSETDTKVSDCKNWGVGSVKSGKTITYTWNASTKALSWEIEADPVDDTVEVYVKNGTIGGTAAYGTSVAALTANNTETAVCTLNKTDDLGYKVYKASRGGEIRVTTTMNSSYTDGYYVCAFSVNGVTYFATEGQADSSGNKTYYADIPVGKISVETEEIETDGNYTLEITPIYYVNDCKDATKRFRFYVNAAELTGAYSWGNTIACYSYYYKNDTGADTASHEADGAYPGQPMLFDRSMGTQGMYYAYIPKTMNGKNISGVTINNYNNDSVHSTINTGLGGNKQSYDYNDFKYLSDLGNDIIRFDVKPRSAAAGSNKSITTEFNYETYRTRNGWDPFTDSAGNKKDIFGYDVETSNTNRVYVVSTASHDYTSQRVGEWATNWLVYGYDSSDGTTTLLASGLPSDFIPRPVLDDNGNITSTTFTKIDPTNENNSKFVGAEVEITYENAQDIKSAVRFDGRWYYASSNTEVTAEVKYQVQDAEGTWSELKSDASVASITSGSDSTPKTSITFPTRNETGYFSAGTLTGYAFAGWATVDMDGNVVPNTNLKSSSFSTTVTDQVTYVALYVNPTSGTLKLYHEKYTGTGAKGGTGYYKISAEVYDENENLVGTASGTGTGASGQSIPVSVESDYSYIKVTLTTITSGENTFRYWYSASDNGYEIIDDEDGIYTLNGATVSESNTYNSSGTLTYTFEIPVFKLFTQNEDSSYTQQTFEYKFYSDISPVTKDYTLTYVYKDRFGNTKQYVYKGKHNDDYYEKHENSWVPDEALIYEHAPEIDDLYKNCKWKLANRSDDGTSVTLTADQESKTYSVTIYDEKGLSTPFALPLNSYVINPKTGTYYVAPETYNNKKFLYWEVTENNEIVARCYQYTYTLLVAGNYTIRPVYENTTDETVVHISDAQYTREKYTNNGVEYDYLYADFVLSYMPNAYSENLINTSNTIKTGLLVEVNTTSNGKLSEKNITGNKADYSGITYESNKDSLEKIANNGTSAKYTYADGDTRIVYNFKATNSNYNNFNRLDYFVKFKNTESNCSYVMKAYYYVIKEDGTVLLSEHVYFNLYNIGHSTAYTDKNEQQA